MKHFVPMHKHMPYLALLAIIASLGVASIVSRYSSAQVEEIQNVSLLKEYFLPIQADAPIEEGKILIGGNECEQVIATGDVVDGIRTAGEGIDTCDDKTIDQTLGYSPQLNAGTSALRKTADGLSIERGNVTVMYEVTVTDTAVYQLKITARNQGIGFNNLNRNDIKALNLVGYTFPASSLFGIDDTINRHIAARRLMFQVAIDEPTQIVGVTSMLDTGLTEHASINVGVLQPGTRKIYLTYANDLDIAVGELNNQGSKLSIGDACTTRQECGLFECVGAGQEGQEGSCQLSVGPLAGETLDKTPLIQTLELYKTQRTNDVLGVRVYTNPLRLSAGEWYRRNLVRQGNPSEFVVDGYRGVLDERTAYINAANVTEDQVYTNIYVIAHNINASAQTIEIFNRIINNWKFNKNIIEADTDEQAENTKNKLRRDVRRLEDTNEIVTALENYKRVNGRYPSLEAGTFERGHAVSTWPTWQSILGNELGILLPRDPLNVMATDFYPYGSANTAEPRQYDCTNEYEARFCETVCTRDAANQPLTGCQNTQQCVADQYCSVVPAGYDPATGWSQDTAQLWFAQNKNTDGSYNTAGDTNDYTDDAFAYQYTTTNGGESYVFNYRLEYKATCTKRSPDGTCIEISSSACGVGSCFVEELGCVAPGSSPYTLFNEDDTTRENYRNLYCFAGALINSCGNGIYQPEAGESCEFNTQFGDGAFCDERYGIRQWYNEGNISETCTTSCQLRTEVEGGQLPLAYNPQQPGLSCGGFCGDGIIQYEYSEQCDIAESGNRTLLKPYQGGSGGVSGDSQYLCTPPTGSSITANRNLIINSGFETQGGNEWSGLTRVTTRAHAGSASARVTNAQPTLSTTITSTEYALDVAYTFEAYILKDSEVDTQEGNVSAQIEFLKDGQSATSPDGAYGIDACNHNGISGGTACSFTTIPVSLADLSTTAWRRIAVTLPSVPAGTNALRVSINGTGDTFAFFVDDVRLIPIGGCQSYGGYCGDGIVQTIHGEACDILSHIPPTPQRSVHQFINQGFEAGLSGWQVFEGGILQTQSEQGVMTVINTSDVQQGARVITGFRSLLLQPKASGTGVAQSVLFQPTFAGAPTTITVSADIKGTTGYTAYVRAYQVDQTTQQFVPFNTGQATQQYLEAQMTRASGDTRTPLIDAIAKGPYSASITIPPASAQYPNTVNMLALIFKADTTDGTVVTSGPIYVDEVVATSNFKLNYACTTVNSRMCQFSGGYCGDGIVQPQFGEGCDLGSANGQAGQACSRYCSIPMCGDGVTDVQVINGEVVPELCDPTNAQDPNREFCNFECTKLLSGGSCSSSSQCESGNCIGGLCSFKFGERGCNPNSTRTTCPDGSVCDPTSSMCRPTLDTYLTYKQSSLGVPYGDQTIYCPNLVTNIAGVAGQESYVISEQCTGLDFERLDVSVKGSRAITHKEAVQGCIGGYELPTLRQLYALTTPDIQRVAPGVPQWPYLTGETGLEYDDATVYTDNAKVKVCTKDGRSSQASTAGSDGCFATNDTRYIYWTATPYGKPTCFNEDGDIVDLAQEACTSPNTWDTHYYAVDFGKKQVYAVPPVAEIGARCVLQARCGDGVIQGNEQCEFTVNDQEVVGNQQCSVNPEAQKRAPYEAGKVHCDPQSCQLRFDNCLLIAGYEQGAAVGATNSCTEICNEVVAAHGNGIEPGTGGPGNSFLKSFGINLTENYLSRSVFNAGDTNRRPMRNAEVVDGGEVFITDEKTEAFVYDTYGNEGSYSVADDGRIMRVVDGVSTYVADEDNTTGAVTKQGVLGVLGLFVQTVINWNEFDIYTGGTSVTPRLTTIDGEATLCNCAVPKLPELTVTGDITQLLALNDAESAVRQAELAFGSGDFSTIFSDAQELVSGLSAQGVTNTSAIQALQDRLNLLAENQVLYAESLITLTSESFSRWKLDENTGRVGYNSGPGRATLSEGAGGTMKVGTSPAGTFNISWVQGVPMLTGVDAYSDATAINYAMKIDGDDYLYTEVSNGRLNQATLSFWYRLDDAPAQNSAITLWSTRDSKGTTYALKAQRANQEVQYQYALSCGGTDPQVNTDLRVGTWNFLALTHNNTTLTLYGQDANGAVVELASAQGCTPLELVSSDSYVFGALSQATGYTENIKGSFDEIRAYYTSKTIEELTAIAQWSDVNAQGGLQTTNTTARATDAFMYAISQIHTMLYTITRNLLLARL